MHLLKWKYQSDQRTNSWRSTIREHRKRLKDAFEDSPSLKPYYLEIFPNCYQDARELASDVQITPIIMGTWQAGKSMWVGIEDAETIKAIREAFDAGITTVDTAEVYGNGHSEQIVAQALSDVREQVTYATKVFANHLKYDQVIEACEESLKRLKTDYIDL